MVKVNLFFNGQRGLNVYKFLKGKKDIKIQKIFLAKKFINKSIVSILKKKKIAFSLGSEKKVNSFLLKEKENTDLNIFCGFPYIIKNNYFNLAKLGSLNLHAGKLPQYRGGSPLNWQIINGEKKISISVIKMSKGIDTGDIVKETSFKLLEKDDIKSVHKKCNDLFPKLTYLSIIKILKKKKLKKQKKTKIKYYKQRSFDDGRINWKNQNSKEVFNFVRALTFPYHCAYTIFKKKFYFIKKCSQVKDNCGLKQPGDFVVKKNKIIVKTKKNCVIFSNHMITNHAKKVNNFKFDQYV